MKPGGSRLTGWLALASLLCLAGGGFVFLANIEDPPPLPGLGAFKITVESDESGDGPGLTSEPDLLEIPAIEVRTKLIKLGKNPDGTLEVPKNYNEAGWWTGGPRPGEPGPSVVTGHVDSETSGPAIFARLGELARGDIVTYTSPSGKQARFEVMREERVSKNDFPTQRVYGRARGSELRLITCTGGFDFSTGHYNDNLIVFARRV